MTATQVMGARELLKEQQVNDMTLEEATVLLPGKPEQSSITTQGSSFSRSVGKTTRRYFQNPVSLLLLGPNSVSTEASKRRRRKRRASHAIYKAL